ncbi:MAG TPA: HEAT repeat domain-containing protein [Aggregatilineales bacterium]|nr:HEAT repeat domain-containing protein [Aggregatilineales bacterium]
MPTPNPVPNIVQMQAKGDVNALTAALGHPDASVRRGAAAALRALGAWQSVPALEAALAVEQDWQANAILSAALQYLGRDIHIERMVKSKDIRGLAKMLTSAKVEDIQAACDALAAVGDRRAVEPLVMVFRNPLMPNPARLSAAEALLKLESAPAVVTLLGALRREDWQVRRNAAAVLGQLQAVWATEPLISALQDEHQAVRRTAAAALRRINTLEARKAADSFDETQAKTITQAIPADQPAATGTKPPGTGTLKSGAGMFSSPASDSRLNRLRATQQLVSPTDASTPSGPVAAPSLPSMPSGTGPLKRTTGTLPNQAAAAPVPLVTSTPLPAAATKPSESSQPQAAPEIPPVQLTVPVSPAVSTPIPEGVNGAAEQPKMPQRDLASTPVSPVPAATVPSAPPSPEPAKTSDAKTGDETSPKRPTVPLRSMIASEKPADETEKDKHGN